MLNAWSPVRWLAVVVLAVGFCAHAPLAGAFEGDEAAPAAAAETEAHGGHDGGHAEAPGPPMEFTKDLALWSAVVFVMFLFVLKKFAWGPMIEGLDKRESGIRQAIADAEENRRKSQAMLAEYEQKLKAAEQTVQQMIAEARRDAERTGQELVANAQKEVQTLRDRARDDIRQARDQALTEVFTSVNAQVIRATEHVLGRSLNESDQDRLVEEALASIGR